MTLIQKEHLHAIASCLYQEAIAPEVFRRNIVVSGLNLLALKGKRFRIGNVVLEYTGLCHPCICNTWTRSGTDDFLGRKPGDSSVSYP